MQGKAIRAALGVRTAVRGPMPGDAPLGTSEELVTIRTSLVRARFVTIVTM